MQCSCGSETRDHDVAQQGAVVACYARCVSCGRVFWRWDHRSEPPRATNGNDQLVK